MEGTDGTEGSGLTALTAAKSMTGIKTGRK